MLLRLINCRFIVIIILLLLLLLVRRVLKQLHIASDNDHHYNIVGIGLYAIERKQNRLML